MGDKLQKAMTASPRTERIAWLVLGAAIVVSATWLLLAGYGLSFANDDLFYYAHYVTNNGVNVPTHGLEYFSPPATGTSWSSAN